MDTCKICGRKNPLEDANFCYYCGASFREGDVGDAINYHMPRQLNTAPILHGSAAVDPEDVTEWNRGSVTRAATDEEQELLHGRAFGKWKWFGTFLLLLFPVGWIAFFVIMCISAFGSSATAERKEMARGFLMFAVVMGIILVIGMIELANNPEFMDQYMQQLQSMTGGQ